MGDYIVFFFSSRRRHTRLQGDWSSDVALPIWTTAESLSSPDLPRRLIVLGGGPAGCELTQVYASFGSQVTLVEAEPRLLPGEPAFVGEILAVALRRAGAEIRLGSRAIKAGRTADGLTL